MRNENTKFPTAMLQRNNLLRKKSACVIFFAGEFDDLDSVINSVQKPKCML